MVKVYNVVKDFDDFYDDIIDILFIQGYQKELNETSFNINNEKKK